MDDDKATRFISSLVKSIQALCNGFVDFSTSIEVIGHIHLNIDRSVKLNYVLTEEVSKSVSEGSTVFSSHSYHSQAPPSVASKSANDSSNTSQKSRKDNDPLGLSALPREVPNTSKSDSHSHSSNRVNESSNSSHSFSRTSDETVKQENNRSSCQQEDSANRRRKVGPISQRTPSPAAKRVRTNDYSLGAKTMVKEQSYEVIEIKEEPDDEPSVFFGNSGSGQDIQTPDFTNVVMESLDRVNQIEGSELGDGSGGDGMGGPQQPVFPVMFHQNEGMSGGPIPGPSSDPQSVASTSGEDGQSSRHIRIAPYGRDPPFSPPSLGRLPHQMKWRTDLQPFMFGRPRARLQYSTQQMARAIADVEEGKPVRLAAKEHGIPLRSLYHRLKMRSSKKTPDKHQQQQQQCQRREQQQPSSSSETVFADEELQLTVQINEQSQ